VKGLDRAIKSRPASFLTPEHAARLRIGNLEDDFSVIEDADWVIEAIVENLAIKHSLMERIDATRAPYTIISTNTSGIPVASIAEGRSESFRKHFLGTHFFNPPRYLKLLEIIPMPDTLPEVLELICRFGEYRLGKGIVLAKDSPNFIANRLFSGSASFLTDYVLKNEYTVEEVDAITGPPIGNPKTATFRLFDLVGLDVWEHVGKNLAPAIPHDELALRYMRSEQVITLIRTMNERGWLGTKVKQGFYNEVRLPDGGKEFYVLNLKTLEYEPPSKVRFESIGKVRDEPDLGKRLKVLTAADDRAGQLVRALTYQSFAYASERIPEIADTQTVDDYALGFNREVSIETWDMLLGRSGDKFRLPTGGLGGEMLPAATAFTSMLAISRSVL
jgi:3-hydroxyacyl-CoA dehydrogenase